MSERTLTRPVAERTELEQHFHDELAGGRLVFQRTPANAWLPPRSEDPVTLSGDWEWAEASGAATLVSWVTYHIAYHPYFEDKLPYQVAIVELTEGPRMIAPLELGGRSPVLDMPLRLDIRRDGGEWIPVFVPGDGS
ncbi:OB-fold domain-containing protein [Saccharomonospora sp. NPDC046836]|uniref:Zn-ribbon domain-containing OB-fold protein n=1 Tax=Saccharomonospora sp. NPDC046836 TaxID=3156921 RepID=UPI0034085E3E